MHRKPWLPVLVGAALAGIYAATWVAVSVRTQESCFDARSFTGSGVTWNFHRYCIHSGQYTAASSAYEVQHDQ
jgi:hypothetical protein